MKVFATLATLSCALAAPQFVGPPVAHHAPVVHAAPAYAPAPAPYHPAPVYHEEKVPPKPFAYEYGGADAYGRHFAKTETQDDHGVVQGRFLAKPRLTPLTRGVPGGAARRPRADRHLPRRPRARLHRRREVRGSGPCGGGLRSCPLCRRTCPRRGPRPCPRRGPRTSP